MTQQKFGKKYFWFLISLLFVLQNLLFAQNRPYILKNADIVKFDIVKNDTLTSLIGSVNLIYDDIEFFADNAKIFQNKKLIKLNGNVRAIDDTLQSRAEHVSYSHNEKLLHLEKNAVFIEYNSDSVKLRRICADRIDYFKKNKYIEAKENISAYDFDEKANLICEKFFYDFDAGYGKAKLKPVLTFERKENIKIYSKQMELFSKKGKFTATYDVKIKQKKSVAQGNFLIYFQKKEKAILVGKPIFKSDMTSASAQEFQMFFVDESIDELHLIKSAKMYFKNQEDKVKNNYLFADKILIKLKDDKMSHLDATDVHKSLIEQNKKTDKNFYTNKLKTKNLEVFFDKKEKIDKVIAENEISGVYLFPLKKD